MRKYLYGASVQGIQSFIFETGKLIEIIGASEIVEEICTSEFKAIVNKFGTYNEDQLILGAAGNVKYVFENEQTCRNVFRVFEKHILSKAPGITISQAVIPVDNSIKEASQQLEEALRARRNFQTAPPSPGWMISERSRKTGLPSILKKDKDGAFLSLGQLMKQDKEKSGSKKLVEKMISDRILPNHQPKDFSDQSYPGWLAVIHADGNGLGQKLMALAENIQEDNYVQAFRTVSKNLGYATEEAAKNAYDHISSVYKLGKLVARPVILGGDDLTVIIDGSCAFEFTEAFLYEFQKCSKNVFGTFEQEFGSSAFREGLTACAGIAFIKPKFPIHYGVNLSEMLCKQAKKVSKKLISGRDNAKIPASLVFHKVHASHVPDDYDTIIDSELKAQDCRYDYGPYFLEKQQGYPTTHQLKEWVQVISEADAPTSGLRNWLTTLKFDQNRAEQQLQRIREIYPSYIQKLQLEEGKAISIRKVDNTTYNVTHIHDVLSLGSINM